MSVVTAQALQKSRLKSCERMPEEESRNVDVTMLGQTAPSTGSSKREGPIADGGQSCMTDIRRQRGSRSKASLGLEIGRHVYIHVP